MKNKFKIFLCFVMIFVFSLGTCSTAFAYTGYPTDVYKADSICRSYYSDELAGSDVVFLYNTDNKGPALLYLPSKFYSDQSISIHARQEGTNFLIFRADGNNIYLFTFDKQNCYTKPNITVLDGHNFSYKMPFGITLDNMQSRIVSSAKTILDVDGTTVLFQQGTSQSPNPNPEIPPSTPGSNSLSNILNKNSGMLNGVLNEIVAVLPLLIPVLISLLSIRKGIKFTLQTLRKS